MAARAPSVPAPCLHAPVTTAIRPCRSQISDFMSTSSEEIPHAYILEALAASPYLIKAALAEAREPVAASAAQQDLDEIEAALSLLKVIGMREGEQAASRPPFVRRNLLLLHAHLHRERLRALAIAETTSQACIETVEKARRLLDMLLAYCLQVGWVRATLSITELQGLVINGLWDPRDDECRSHMKLKLGAVGLKVSEAHACAAPPRHAPLLHAPPAPDLRDALVPRGGAAANRSCVWVRVCLRVVTVAKNFDTGALL